MSTRFLRAVLGIVGCTAALILLSSVMASNAGASCEPTKPDALGPFYKPNAPVRSSVGQGYVLSGYVRGSPDCAPLEGARIEFWLAGPDGKYDDDHRATVFTDAEGHYRFESNFPPSYFGRPPHIHIRASTKGYLRLVTQHYPDPSQTEATLDLILIPAP